MAVTQAQTMISALQRIAAPSATGGLTQAPSGTAPSFGKSWAQAAQDRLRAQASQAAQAAVPVPLPAPIPAGGEFAPPTTYGGVPATTQALTDAMAADSAVEQEQAAGAQPEQAGFGGIGPLLVIGLVLAFLSGGSTRRRR